MKEFKKSKSKLGKFLKNTKFAHDRKELIKLGCGVASGTLLLNVIFAGTSLGAPHTNTPHDSSPAEDKVEGLTPEAVDGYPKCWRIVPLHVSSPHDSTPHNSAAATY